METIEIFEIKEERLLGFLGALPNLWNARKRSLEPPLKLLFDKFGSKDNLLFVVQAFTHDSGPVMIILLTEYMRDLETARFIIHAYDMNAVRGITEALWSCRRLRDILEDLVEYDLSVFSHLKGDEIFVCPKCSAQYRLRAMRITKDGRVGCQNCGKIVEYTKLDKKEDIDIKT